MNLHSIFRLAAAVIITGSIPLVFYVEPLARATRMLPNVLLISVDTLRADRLGLYGSDKGLTPNMDGAAMDGIFVDKFITSSPWTKASFGTLFTSLFPSHHGAQENIQSGINTALAPRAITMAEILRKYGYMTAAFQSNGKAGEHYGFKRGFDTWRGYELIDKADKLPYAQASKTYDSFSKWFVENRDNSFFVWINFMDAHMPYSPPAKYRKGVVNDDYTGQIKKNFANYRIGRTGHLTSRDKNYIESLYNAEVKYADDYIGRIINLLKQSGIYDSTVTVILSDHGEEFWDHGHTGVDSLTGAHNWGFGHGHTLFDELVRVPFVLRYPPKLGTKGLVTKVEQTISEVDFLPTILEMVGLPKPSTARFDGRSAFGVISGKDKRYKTPDIFMESLLYGSEQKGIRTDGYKLIFEPSSGKVTVFDLKADSGETKDISQKNPETTKKLMASLKCFMSK